MLYRFGNMYISNYYSYLERNLGYRKDKNMNILDFFNPIDIDHLKAYQHLQAKGSWPEGFIPDRVDFTPNWQMTLQSRMADLWVGTNIFVHKMKPSEKLDGIIDMDRLLNIAKDFEKKRKG